MKKPEILDQPVYAILVKPTYLQELEQKGLIPKSQPEIPALPVKEEPKKEKLHLNVLKNTFKQTLNMPDARKMRDQQQIRMRLTIGRDSAEMPSGDEKPPCDTCKTAACCVAFVVNITEMEYESGLYGDFAVKLEPEVMKQLRGRLTLISAMNGPNVYSEETHYSLEGMIGTPCPFLQEDNRCGIYENRPLTCRTYTCVGDERITPGMRDGSEPLLSASEKLFNAL